jgi:hypothetical protein
MPVVEVVSVMVSEVLVVVELLVLVEMVPPLVVVE